MALHFNGSQAAVAAVFLAYFQRAPEFQAMQHYVGVFEAYLANSARPAEALKALSAQVYQDALAAQEAPPESTLSQRGYVEWLYRNILGREAEPDGLTYWAGELEVGHLERAELVAVLVTAAQGGGGQDAAYVQNRLAVAAAFAQWENSNALLLPHLRYNAAEVMQGVNDNIASVEVAQLRLHQQQSQLGEHFFLSQKIDTLLGTHANDVFHAVFEGANETASFTAFDSLDGGLGSDTFNIYLSALSAPHHFPDFAAVRNIEVVNLFNGAYALDDADPSHWNADNAHWLSHLGNYSGLQEFWQWHSSAPVLAVPENVIVGFRNIDRLWEDVFLDDGVKNAQIRLDTVAWRDPAALSTTEGLPWLYVQGNALEAVTLDGTLAPDVPWLMLDIRGGANITSLTLDTAVNTYLGLMPWEREGSSVAQLDATASQGDLLFYADPHWMATPAEGLSLLLGSGNDHIGFDQRGEAATPMLYAGRALGLRDVLDGGAGWDVLELWVQGRVQTQTYDAIAQAANFEEIVFLTPSAATLDAAQVQDFEVLSVGGLGAAMHLGFTVHNLSAKQTLAVTTHHPQPLQPSPPGAWVTVMLEKAEQDLRLELRDADVQLNLGAEPGAAGGILQVWGQGVLEFNNQAGKYSTIDSSTLSGTLWLQGMSAQVAETVWLAEAGPEQWATVRVGANTSTVALTDTLVGFHEQVRLQVELAPGSQHAEVHRAGFKEQATLADALAAAAAQFAGAAGGAALAAHDLIAFSWAGDAYLYGDTVATGQGVYDANDFLLKIVGLNDLTPLLETVVEFV